MSEQAPPESVFALKDGRRLIFRPVTPEDEPFIAEAIQTASRQTLLHRFFTPLRALAPEDLRRMLNLDPAREFCLVGESTEEGRKRIICGARYVRLSDPTRAEIALTVHDDFQGRGIGCQLLKLLMEQGRGDGVRTFVADVLAENTAMLHLLQKLAPRRRSTFSEGVCHIEFELADVAMK
jgi:RimJ/RimL family protein N-acetyltransferase